MAQGYWDAEKAGEEACFTMYFRDYPFKGGYAAVSYTHLDVYKRQAQGQD